MANENGAQMSELRGFWDVNIDDESEPLRHREAAEFLTKMDYEGGVSGLWSYGGVDSFPVDLHDVAAKYGEAEKALRDAVDAWAADRGVRY